jgi:nucleotide-binding universal stress UspA family protein
MDFKNILVHVNVSRHCRKRLELAAALAKSHGATLTGLFTSAVGDVGFFTTEEIAASAQPTMQAWWVRMRGEMRSIFDEVMKKAGIAAQWHQIESDIAAMVPYRARYADLIVVGQLDRNELLPRPEYAIPERVLLNSGRPVVMVPCAGSFTTIGRRMLVAWNASPQAARALRDALPLLAKAESIAVLTINPDTLRKEKGDNPAAHAVSYLASHGIKAEAQNFVVEDIEADDFILSRAADMGADSIVMGAYGHARAGEIIFGGATRHSLQHMTVPLLMSH